MHHSDAGSQYTSIRYTDRLVEAGLHASIGTVGDSYDNALAETVNGLYKAELIYWEGPWRNADDLELATLGWVDWFNNTRLHSGLSYRTPAEVEAESRERLLGGVVVVTVVTDPLTNPGRFSRPCTGDLSTRQK